MKAFVIGEIRNALRRLRRTFQFGVKVIFIAIVNVIFWFMPLVVMGYFLAKPLVRDLSARSVNRAGQTASPLAPVYESSESYANAKGPVTGAREMLNSAGAFLREIRFLKQR
ncbi:MAG: hypothetical protein COV74_00150 [Candidatus Omnitrophica bacterium CG11_big_fil_rev_8_21_14_0_20_45_26]|uniref:Uncharacterized protein n=1 Tax=Candidatus Abzuiibacterium crystallinum TaxID=1974748 RepID=A0A2H0LT24_9BACT|nr:MAG: hypothetical protein COV74_00150 [Candidatus Omnitrophica bacterium CG11_big_fil_rev_8_21_14_0_20_45_26]PIW64796.1 MAG: hypothetical protein COW12_04655 [Candidatus Omnitrophica bacterium CG12_big_fil_rev_8_21_14_0_65_45_16]